MADALSEFRKLLNDRLGELDGEEHRLKKALRELGGRSSGRPKERSPRKTRKNARRAPRGRRREQLLAAVKKMPGAPVSELAAEIGISSSQVHGLAGKAEAEKLVVGKGKGFAIVKK